MVDQPVEQVIQHINSSSDASWRLVGPLLGGSQSGAWKIESPVGVQAVLKLAMAPDWAAQVVRAERAVAKIRRLGYPTPAWLSAGITEPGVGYELQALAAGRSVQVINLDRAHCLVDLIESQGALDPDPERCWSDVITSDVGTHFDRLCATVEATGSAGERLVRTSRQVLDGVDRHELLPRMDMVHGDFRLANILFDNDRVSAVVDIEAIGSGTRSFDYATLLDHPEIDPDAMMLLIAAGSDAAGPDVLLLCLVRVVLDLARFIHHAELPMTDAHRSQRIEALSDRVRAVTNVLREQRAR